MCQNVVTVRISLSLSFKTSLSVGHVCFGPEGTEKEDHGCNSDGLKVSQALQVLQLNQDVSEFHNGTVWLCFGMSVSCVCLPGDVHM